MVFEVYYGTGIKFPEWRCIACGNVVDAYILVNRLRQARPNKRFRLQGKLKLWMASQGPKQDSPKEDLLVA
jgi:hypothetical protein